MVDVDEVLFWVDEVLFLVDVDEVRFWVDEAFFLVINDGCFVESIFLGIFNKSSTFRLLNFCFCYSMLKVTMVAFCEAVLITGSSKKSFCFSN